MVDNVQIKFFRLRRVSEEFDVLFFNDKTIATFSYQNVSPILRATKWYLTKLKNVIDEFPVRLFNKAVTKFVRLLLMLFLERVSINRPFFCFDVKSFLTETNRSCSSLRKIF